MNCLLGIEIDLHRLIAADVISRFLEELVIAREQARHGRLRGRRSLAGGRGLIAHQQSQQVHGSRSQAFLKLLDRLTVFDGAGGQLFFLGNVIDAHERGRVADVLRGLLVLLDEQFEDARVALDLRVGALCGEINDLRLLFLAVTVDATVALLEHHQRPRDVEVDHPVARGSAG